MLGAWEQSDVSLKTSPVRVKRVVLDTPEEIQECLLLLPTRFLRMTPRQRKVNVKGFNVSKHLSFLQRFLGARSFPLFLFYYPGEENSLNSISLT